MSSMLSLAMFLDPLLLNRLIFLSMDGAFMFLESFDKKS